MFFQVNVNLIKMQNNKTDQNNKQTRTLAGLLQILIYTIKRILFRAQFIELGAGRISHVLKQPMRRVGWDQEPERCHRGDGQVAVGVKLKHHMVLMDLKPHSARTRSSQYTQVM